MKKNKSLLSLGIIALILVLGVGYAVVNQVGLTFGGTATAENADIKVDIESVTVNKDDESTVVVDNTLVAHGKEDTFTITGMKLNEAVGFEYTIMNHETDVVAEIVEAAAISNSNTNNFTVTVSREDDFTTLQPGESKKVYIVVTLTKTPLTSNEGETTITYTLNAKAKENASSAS